jgi:hypothetical protein
MSCLQTDYGHYIVGQTLCFFYIFNDASVIPCLRVCIKVFCDMHITVFVKNEEVVSEKLGWILGKEVLLYGDGRSCRTCLVTIKMPMIA